MAKTAMVGAVENPPTSSTQSSPSASQPTHTLSDNPSLQITLHKLNGTNYLQWSQSVTLFLRGRGRLGYLTGETKAPTTTDSAYRVWDSDNSMILTWLINSMEVDIGRTYMFFPTIAELWQAVKETYSDLGNASQVFEIKAKLREQKQGSVPVTEYYTNSWTLWQELDLYDSTEWHCPKDAKSYSKKLEKERVFDFLCGLDQQLDEVRGRILGRDPFPTLREPLPMFDGKKRAAKSCLLLTRTHSLRILPSLLKAAPSHIVPPMETAKPLQEILASTSALTDHGVTTATAKDTKDKCWKLHGRPDQPRQRQPSDAQGYITNSQQSPPGLTAEQIEQLKKLLSHVVVAKTGTYSTALISQYSSNDWIVDSGASDHMTGIVFELHSLPRYSESPHC